MGEDSNGGRLESETETIRPKKSKLGGNRSRFVRAGIGLLPMDL